MGRRRPDPSELFQSLLIAIDMYDICMVGLGALGSLYALALHLSGEVRVTAVCRSNREILGDHGVDIESDKFGTHRLWKPYRALSSCTEAADRKYRFTICAFKALPDVIDTPDILGQSLLEKTDTFVLIQNGIGIELDLRKRVPDAVILSACAWTDATVVDNGKRLTQHGRELLTIGLHRPPAGVSSGLSETAAQESLDLICRLLAAGGSSAESVTDIVTERWKKLLWNASISTLCTLTQGDMADILAEPHVDAVKANIRAVIDELISVACKIGVDRETLEQMREDIILRRAKPSPFKQSMLVDREAGRPIEVEVIVGQAVRTAALVGVSVPRLELIYADLRVLQYKLIKQRHLDVSVFR